MSNEKKGPKRLFRVWVGDEILPYVGMIFHKPIISIRIPIKQPGMAFTGLVNVIKQPGFNGMSFTGLVNAAQVENSTLQAYPGITKPVNIDVVYLFICV